ncbi:hypothetical protein CAC42_6179 [Sphaceloma murrayae]|uniref:Cercosporin MFS transporter CTB4 n=1 Tax=Sphaceloma murrayae TaxID=2082308 RepID=A0A2K1QTH1_9PEZI|nr:hypothetical protein CAC42_6179 [Sphaceloma murrayae]
MGPGNGYGTIRQVDPDEEEGGVIYVDWEDENDPTNPMNWAQSKKNLNVAIVSLITFLASLATAMPELGIPELMHEFGSSSSVLASFVVSIYVLGYAIGPMLLAPLSEIYGRTALYHSSNLFFFVTVIICGLSTNLPMLIVFRFLSGCAGAAPVAIGAGTIADTIPPQKRGSAIAVYSLGPILGPVLGPIIGGFFAVHYGWRSVFWCLAVLSAALTLGSFIGLTETHAKTVLRQKARELTRWKSGKVHKSSLDISLPPPGAMLATAMIRPIKIFFLSPVVFFSSIYVAIAYGYLFLMLTTFPSLFLEQYGMKPENLVFTFMPQGVGFLIGMFVSFKYNDRIAMGLKAKHGSLEPEHRLPLMVWSAPLTPIGLFAYGWSAQLQLPWAIPLLSTVLTGTGLLLIMLPLQTYLVDAFTMYAASAIAAATVLRCTFGAFVPLAGGPLYSSLGYGWGTSVLGFISLASLPVPFLLMKYGGALREKYPVRSL